MAQRVRQRREVSINSVRFPLGGDGRVHQSVSSQYPQKQVFGDVDQDSNPNTSIVVWEDWRAGVGLYSTDGKEGLQRSYFSRADGRNKNHLTLPPLFTNSADASVAGYIGPITQLGTTKLYAALGNGTDAYSWTVGSNTWSSKLHDFPAEAREAIRFFLGGTEYIAFATTHGYTYTSDGISWTDNGTNASDFAFWDNRLWGIDFTGQLWFSVTIGTEVNDARLDLPTSTAFFLFVGPDAEGRDILYVATPFGLYAHDAANSKFIRTKVVFPQRDSTDEIGKDTIGAATWNGDIYITAGGMSIFRYDPVTGSIRPVGLDLDAGLSISGLRGDIVALVPATTELIAVVNATDADLTWGYNGVGWHYYFRGAAIKGAHYVGDIGGNYRFYWTTGSSVIRYAALQSGMVNPDIDTISYDDGTEDAITHETPWFNAGQNEIDKLAIRVRIDCTGMSANETVKVEFALDYSASYQASTFTVTADGVTTNTFPTIADNNSEAGSSFRAIRFRLTLSQSTGTTSTPNVKSLSLEWRRKIPTRYRGSMVIDHTRRYGGRSAKELKAALITAVELSTMAEVTWVDDGGDTQNYFCDVSLEEDSGESGRKETGMTKITVVEN